MICEKPEDIKYGIVTDSHAEVFICYQNVILHLFTFHFFLHILLSAIGLVALLQKKGDDFSEETNKEFVKVCLKFERTDVLITEFSKFKLRMGAWTTPATLEM